MSGMASLVRFFIEKFANFLRNELQILLELSNTILKCGFSMIVVHIYVGT